MNLQVDHMMKAPCGVMPNQNRASFHCGPPRTKCPETASITAYKSTATRGQHLRVEHASKQLRMGYNSSFSSTFCRSVLTVEPSCTPSIFTALFQGSDHTPPGEKHVEKNRSNFMMKGFIDKKIYMDTQNTKAEWNI